MRKLHRHNFKLHAVKQSERPIRGSDYESLSLSTSILYKCSCNKVRSNMLIGLWTVQDLEDTKP